jgi:hypothetical protein
MLHDNYLRVVEWFARSGRLAETLDRDVFRTQNNRLDMMFRALAPGYVNLFLDATSFFDDQDFFQYWNYQRVSFLPRARRFG